MICQGASKKCVIHGKSTGCSMIIISDTHLEYVEPSQMEDYLISRIPKDTTSDDIVFVPGDLANVNTIEQALNTLRMVLPHNEIVFVPGNHEYFRNISKGEEKLDTLPEHISIAKQNDIMEQICDKNNIHFLNNSAITLKGHRILGTTGWYPYTPQMVMSGSKYANDFFFMDWKEINAANEKAREFITKNSSQDDIIVTHFLPFGMRNDQHDTQWSVMGLPQSFFYDTNIKLWVFGHIHFSVNDNYGFYMYCNPSGYPFKSNEGFNREKFVLE